MFAVCDAFQYQLARFEHLECHKSIQRRECRIPYIVGYSLSLGSPSGALVLDCDDDFASLKLLASRQVPTTLRSDLTASEYIKCPLELSRKVPIEQFPRPLGRCP